jgi:APA family basic amino acid/polyamine antiporter
MVVGGMIGSGVFLLPASLAPYGGLAFAGWVVSAAGSVLLAFVFAWLTRLHPSAGGPYAFTRQAFGDLAGFLVAWGYWLSICSANAALAIAFVAYLDPFIPDVVASPVAAAALAIALVWVLTIVNIRSVREAGRVQVVTTAIKILPLVIIGIVGLVRFDPVHFGVPAAMPASPGGPLLAVTTLTLFAFLGLECGTVPADVVKDPARTIPRATIIGTLVAAAIYIISTAGVMSALAPDVLATSRAPFADAARHLFGDAAARAVAVGAAISALGSLNGWVLMAGQVSRAVALDGLFPAFFARESSRGTPAIGLVVAAALSSVLVAMNYSSGLVALFTFATLLSTLSTLVPYACCSLAWLILGGTRPAARAVVAVLAFIYSAVAIAGAGMEVVYWGSLLFLAGLPTYVWGTLARRRKGMV